MRSSRQYSVVHVFWMRQHNITHMEVRRSDGCIFFRVYRRYVEIRTVYTRRHYYLRKEKQNKVVRLGDKRMQLASREIVNLFCFTFHLY